jgi:hypothetical protein
MKTKGAQNLEGDVVLIYHQDQPSVYARIEAIEPDVKKDWYHVTLLMLTIPAQPVTWILREEYIQGTSFTMGGQPLRIEGVERVSPELPDPDEETTPKDPGSKPPAKVIPLHKQKP